MRKFIILFLFLGIIGWHSVGTIPTSLFTGNNNYFIRFRIIQTLIKQVHLIQPSCQGAYIDFIPTKNEEMEVLIKCSKWGT